MAVTALNSTTLTSQIAAGDNDFAVGSTANIVAGSVLAFAGRGGLELMKVQVVPVSGRVQVLRGWAGTRARTQQAGTNIWIGATPDAFKTVRDNAAAIVGDSSYLPDYCFPGTRARDGAGNEYIMVDLTFTAFVGAGVIVSHDGLYTATPIVSTSAGSVGVLMEEGTSNQWAWAQIYGFCDVVQLVGGSSLVTSTGLFLAATSATTITGIRGITTSQGTTIRTVQIFGMWPASAATTATTSATSATGLRCSAFLNYPYLLRQVSS